MSEEAVRAHRELMDQVKLLEQRLELLIWRKVRGVYGSPRECRYCGTRETEHRAGCLAGGAVIEGDLVPKTTAQDIVALFDARHLWPSQRDDYFDRRKGGRLGCSISGALAILAGGERLDLVAGTMGTLLYPASDAACDRYPAWFRYGARDGWHGEKPNQDEAKAVQRWNQYQTGYRLGREAAELLGLKPRGPERGEGA